MDLFIGRNPLEAIRDNMTRVGSSSHNVVVDMDEVLVNISPPWFAKAMLDPRIIQFIGVERVGWIAEQNLVPFVLSRATFILKEWMGLDEEHGRIMDEIYFGNCHSFYDRLPPTSFCNALMSIADSPALARIFIVTHVPEGENNSKKRFIDKYMANQKVELVEVPLGSSKSEAINRLGVPYASFTDDLLTNLEDVLQNTDSWTKEFLMPKLGYNSNITGLEEIARSRFAKLGKYQAVL